MRNIFAYTEPTPTDGYPGYISVNMDSVGKTFISVRTPGHRGEMLACLEVPDRELAKLAVALMHPKNFTERKG